MLETVVHCGFEAAIEVVVSENRVFDEFLSVVNEYTCWLPILITQDNTTFNRIGEGCICIQGSSRYPDGVTITTLKYDRVALDERISV